jgi:L,D-peptidoglycan transpeptidase YkuD (ErfK/YbiS/YcfS/YnhG family)
VTHPYPASAERMWRADAVYDLVAILGHNDDPVVPGAGSAIFLHIARPGYAPTEGCVALAADDLRALLKIARPGDAIAIREA